MNSALDRCDVEGGALSPPRFVLSIKLHFRLPKTTPTAPTYAPAGYCGLVNLQTPFPP